MSARTIARALDAVRGMTGREEGIPDMIRELMPRAAVALVLVGSISCSSEPETPEQPYPTSTAPEPVPPPPPPPPAEPTVQTGPCDATMQVAMQAAIGERAKKELSPGLKPESNFTCMLVAEGGTVQVPVTLQPGKCYAVIAHSYPNITDIDVYLKPNLGPNPPPLLLPFANMVLAQDSEQGPIASIGSGQNQCYKNPLPMPGAAVVEGVAKAGAGPLAIQIYVK